MRRFIYIEINKNSWTETVMNSLCFILLHRRRDKKNNSAIQCWLRRGIPLPGNGEERPDELPAVGLCVHVHTEVHSSLDEIGHNKHTQKKRQINTLNNVNLRFTIQETSFCPNGIFTKTDFILLIGLSESSLSGPTGRVALHPQAHSLTPLIMLDVIKPGRSKYIHKG